MISKVLEKCQDVAPTALSPDTQGTEWQAIADNAEFLESVVLVDENEEESEDRHVVIEETHGDNESPELEQEIPPPLQE